MGVDVFFEVKKGHGENQDGDGGRDTGEETKQDGDADGGFDETCRANPHGAADRDGLV